MDDHPPLRRAVRAAADSGGGVLPVLVIDPHWFGQTDAGFARIGPHRRKFLKESIEELIATLGGHGVPLVVRVGDPAEVLDRIAETLGDVVSVDAHREYPPEERRIERRVRRRMDARGIEVHLAAPGTLYAPDDLPFSIGQTPEVFSKFRRIVEKEVEIPPAFDSPDHIPPPRDGAASVCQSVPIESVEYFSDDALCDRGLNPYFDDDDGDVPEPPQRSSEMPEPPLRFQGGSRAGHDRLEHYLFESGAIATYKQTRNGMLGKNDSSRLSPWLAHGCLSARRIAQRVHQFERERVANDSTYWLIFELLWRDYFALMMAKHQSHLFKIGGIRRQVLPWRTDEARFELWRRGQTGFPLVDANMRELAATGFMSNRGRQNVASFLTKNLGIEWRWGAQWFESCLIDYDAASNWGNWNYAAGVGNDARGFRFFNIIKQSRDYDADGRYVRHWCRELADVPNRYVHQPYEMDAASQRKYGCVVGVDYPNPVVDLFQSADANRRAYEQSTREPSSVADSGGYGKPSKRGDRNGNRSNGKRSGRRDRSRR